MEAGFYSVMVGATETFSIYYSVRRGVTPAELATISMLPILLGALAGWILPPFIRQINLKKTLLICVFTQVLALVGLFFSVDASSYVLKIILCLSLYFVGAYAAAPLWTDWISGWLPRERMSRYLSRRNAYTWAVTVTTYLLLAVFAYRSKGLGVFKVIFGLAAVARLGSFILLSIQQSPALTPAKVLKQSFVFREASNSKALLLVIFFTVIFRFGSNMGSTFLIPYFVESLHCNLLQFAVLTAVPYAGRALFLSGWGETTRQFRPLVGLQLACFGLTLIPLGWISITHLGWLTATELIDGMFWGGFEIGCLLILQNFSHGNARGLIGMHTALLSLTALLGALLGSYFLDHGFKYIELFQFSFAIRAVVALLFFFFAIRTKELTTSVRIYSDFLWSVVSLSPPTSSLNKWRPKKKFGAPNNS